MDEKNVKDAIKRAIIDRTGAGDWREVRGQEFTHEEARQAADLWDMLQDYHLPPEMYKDFLPETIGVGHSLVIAEKAPLDDIGIVLLAVDDDRVVKVAQARTEEEKQGEGKIIIP